MGTYGISTEELIEPFKGFLATQEGEISALTIAECWNKLAEENQWEDNLIAIDKKTKKQMKD